MPMRKVTHLETYPPNKPGFNHVARAAWTPGLHLLYLQEVDIGLPMRKDL